MSSNRPLQVVFAGTPEFAAVALQALFDSSHQVVAVYTQPDRPAGRGRKLRPSPVKVLAMQQGIEVRQPKSLRSEEAQTGLAALAADVMVVAAYGLILPVEILETPRLGCINIHASLLPRWRGAAPIQRAILAGDTETGVTIMQMDVGLDTGAMLLKRSCAIAVGDTAQVVHDRLAQLGGEAQIEALTALAAGTLTGEPQSEAQSCYAAKLSKAEALIDWSRPAIDLARQVCAFNPWPVAQTPFADGMLRVWQAEAITPPVSAAPGTLVAAGKTGIDVATGEGVLRLLQLQLPGGRAVAAADLLNANERLRSVGYSFMAESGTT